MEFIFYSQFALFHHVLYTTDDILHNERQNNSTLSQKLLTKKVLAR